MRTLSSIAGAVLLALLAGLPAAAPADETDRSIAAIRARLERETAELDTQLQKARAVLEEEYAVALHGLETQFQTDGWLRGSIALYDERKRFAKSHDVSPAAAGAAAAAGGDLPPELLAVQETLRAKFKDVQLRHASALVALHEGYLRSLAELARKWPDDPDAQMRLGHENDRVLDLPAVRAAVAALASAAQPGLARSGTPEIPADAETREWKLYRMNSESAETTMAYDLSLEIVSFAPDLRVTKSMGTRNYLRSESGETWYIPRLKLACRNATIAPNTHLVIEYFSRSLTDTDRRREKTETLALPALDRGQSLALAGQGMKLFKSESTGIAGKTTSLSITGREFFGVIVTIYDDNGQIVLRRFSPQSLYRESSPPPAEIPRVTSARP